MQNIRFSYSCNDWHVWYFKEMSSGTEALSETNGSGYN